MTCMMSENSLLQKKISRIGIPRISWLATALCCKVIIKIINKFVISTKKKNYPQAPLFSKLKKKIPFSNHDLKIQNHIWNYNLNVKLRPFWIKRKRHVKTKIIYKEKININVKITHFQSFQFPHQRYDRYCSLLTLYIIVIKLIVSCIILEHCKSIEKHK